MWKIILYSLVQSALLVGGQVFLKFALMRMPAFAWTREFWLSLLSNWQFAACGLFFGAASLLWMYIVKTFPFSMAYPMVSLSYVMGMVAAIMFFHEEVSMTRWIGVAFIVLGCFLIAK
ncbi:MAG: EamA family transporter [Prevotella sp.]|nr:EamA family transporter [Prevotella sp.]